MIDNKTQRLALPLPNVDNYLEDDVARLADALTILDEKVATVGDDGKIPVSQIPAVALTDTFPVNSEADMLALNAQPGDVAIRNDLSKSFILMAAPATMLGNWKEFLNDALVQLASNDGERLIGICPNIAALRSIQPKANGQRITLREHTSGTGKGGGQFRAVMDGSAYTDDNGTIIKTAGGAAWLRINADKVNPLMFGALGDGTTDDVVAIQAMADSTNSVFDFIGLRYKINDRVKLNKPCILFSSGSVIEQGTWGVPGFEINAPNIKMYGTWRGEYLGDRTAVISANTLGYSYVTSGDWKAYGSFIWQNYYQSRDVSGFHIDRIEVFGFIAGIWFTGKDATIGSAFFQDVDFGVFGVVMDNQRIENGIYHKNITASQGHEGHALYTNGTGKGFYCGPVYVEGSPLACSPVKIHTTKGFRIESISGVGLATIAYFRNGTTGSVGAINCVCDVNANFSGPGQDPSNYNILLIDAGTEVTFGPIRVVANQSGSVKQAFIQCSGGGRAILQNGYSYKNTNADALQPIAVNLTSGGGMSILGGTETEHPNSTATSVIFNLLSYSDFYVAVPPKVKIAAGGKVKLVRNVYASSNNYQMAYDPDLISPAPDENTIVCTGNQYWGHMFRGVGKTPFDITGVTPVVTHGNFFTLQQTAVTNVGRLRYAAPGQEIVLWNKDKNSNLVNNTFAGLDGNLITPSGTTIAAASWSFARVKKIGVNMTVISYS